MALQIDDWDSIDTSNRRRKDQTSDIIFLKAKYLPLELIPTTDKICRYFSVWDPDARRSKEVAEFTPGAKQEFAFHALIKDDSGESAVRVCIAGKQLAERINAVVRTVRAIDDKVTPVVRATASGSGMDTTYAAEATGDTVPTLLWAKYQTQVDALAIDRVITALLGGKSEDKATGKRGTHPDDLYPLGPDAVNEIKTA